MSEQARCPVPPGTLIGDKDRVTLRKNGRSLLKPGEVGIVLGSEPVPVLSSHTGDVMYHVWKLIVFLASGRICGYQWYNTLNAVDQSCTIIELP